MVINERCINILSVLNETNEFTLKRLSENFNVHTRTIRYDIDNINYILKMYKLDTIRKCEKGVFTVNLKNNEINKIINDFSGMFSENRRRYLKLKLFSKEIVNLTKEAEYLNTSRTTLKKDLMIIKEELLEKLVEIKELPSKGIKISGNEELIVRVLEKEIFEIIEKQFINLPNLIKNMIGKIVGDISPDILRNRVREILGENYNINYYNKVFCKLAAVNTRHKLEKKIKKYNTEEITEFILCELGEEFIKKVVGENKNKKKDKIVEIKDVLKEVVAELELDDEQNLIENLLSEINEVRERLPIPEKICETSFYKEFSEKIKGTELIKKDIQSIFYIIYNNLLLKNYEAFKNMKILFVSDEVDSVKDIILNKLKIMFNFQEIDKVSSHIFEIFGCEKEYDLIITSGNINEILETPIYRINRFPLESNLLDLKFFILKNIK
ncbi:HTH domain-containing protein [Cetobacterium sp. 2G large]|uniref:HTH domain-containing protein n=1 Tax=Cetobacterium sp. 2G large TaxID=2759680 RepID=UPI00163BA938|nr:HTH domain-containing protein [Cetobacterium sp. 2G large]MBC2854128.1 HTH domain-containing protein [Cetobacterium sp. 2G large]